ncbi:hypothetical protein [Rhodococcus ruber]|uniref:hypothetical protein n=1 Tax=Rhodococcus ruber TaxID=1830 RepID=UPI003D817716
MSIRDELAGLMYEAGLADDPDSDDLTAAADAILARFAVVELPEPAVDRFGNPDFSNEHIRLTVYRDGCVQLETPEYFGVNTGIHPFQLRDMAQRCLAAAKIAERRRS